MGIGLGQDWSHAIYTGITGNDPFYRFRLRKPEQQRLLEVARNPTPENSCADFPQSVKRSIEDCARDYAIITIMLYGGLLIEEIIGLEANAAIADNDKNFWISVTGLHGEARCQPLVSKVSVDAVSDYLSITARKPDDRGPLFSLTNSEPKERAPLTVELLFSILVSLMQEAQVEQCRITPFALRNSFSNEWLDSGRDVNELQRILGIKSSRAMKCYVDDLKCPLINYEVGHRL